MKKELAKSFPSKDFSWIDDILLEEEDEVEGERAKDTPRNWGILKILPPTGFLLIM